MTISAKGERRRAAAIMQPYFAPYAGYYRLLAAADVFVIYDCVQFPRRGWVHRNRLPGSDGEPAWLTLPLKPAPFDARIDAMTFAEDAAGRMAERIRAFPSLAAAPEAATALLHAGPFSGALVDYLERQLALACARLAMAPALMRSSSLGLPPELRGQDRILEICRRVGATDYVNAPGGRDLYDAAAFEAAGVALHFLPPWEGSPLSLLHRLAVEPAEAVAAEIARQTPDYRH